jgi:hypothetical protein
VKYKGLTIAGQQERIQELEDLCLQKDEGYSHALKMASIMAIVMPLVNIVTIAN